MSNEKILINKDDNLITRQRKQNIRTDVKIWRLTVCKLNILFNFLWQKVQSCYISKFLKYSFMKICYYDLN